jgi:drug/metabolite transporter (DMT)-like permease
MTDLTQRPALERQVLWGTLALLLGASCIALAPIMVKLSPLGPQASAFWRLTFALPALAVWAIWENKIKKNQLRDGTIDAATVKQTPFPWFLLALSGFLFAGDLATWHAGIVRTSAANATFLSNLTPIVVVAVTWLTTRLLPKRAYWIAFGIALVGSLLLSGGAPGLSQEQFLGDGLSALTSVWYGFYLLAVARMRVHLGAGTIMLGSSFVAAILCLIVTLVSGEPLFAQLNGQNWLAIWWPLIVLGLVAQVSGQGLLAVGFGLVPTHIASVLILWQPVLAALLGWLILAEALSPLQLLGGALVLLGVWLAKRAG